MTKARVRNLLNSPARVLIITAALFIIAFFIVVLKIANAGAGIVSETQDDIMFFLFWSYIPNITFYLALLLFVFFYLIPSFMQERDRKTKR